MAQARRKRAVSKKPGLLRFDIPWSGLFRWTLALSLFLVTAAAAVWGVGRLADPNTLPMRVVRIDGDFRYLDRKTLERAVIPSVRGGFFTVNVTAVRREALKLAWVDQVRVRRVWPDTLRISIIEQVPLARWGKRRLVNPLGQIFQPEDGILPAGLPVLRGQDEAAFLVTAGYLALQRVCDSRDLRIASLRRDARGAWHLSLRGGLVVKLGTEGAERRLARFMRLYPSLLARGTGTLKLIDLRYANGFAAHWADEKVSAEVPRTPPESESGRRQSPGTGRAA